MVHAQTVPLLRIPADSLRAGQTSDTCHVDLHHVDAADIHQLPKFLDIADLQEFRQLMDIGGIDVVQVDVTRVGGLATSMPPISISCRNSWRSAISRNFGS